ncbi:MAG: intein-containing recombinase RecA, partial [Gemmatimonadaceae bacterium]
FRGQFAVEPQFVAARLRPVPARILDVRVKPKTRSMNRFDIEVEGNHNYFVDGVMVHNSPETTTGGKALKFYASVRLDIRRIGPVKEKEDVTGSHVRVKVVKNKVAPPFKQAEFDIMYAEGISHSSLLVDIGAEAGIIEKSGAWYSYNGQRIGQGRENAKMFLKDNAALMSEIEEKVKGVLGMRNGSTAEAGEVVEE